MIYEDATIELARLERRAILHLCARDAALNSGEDFEGIELTNQNPTPRFKAWSYAIRHLVAKGDEMAKSKNKGAAATAPAPVAPGAPVLNPLVPLLQQAVTALQTGQPFMVPKETMAGLSSHPLGQLVECAETVTDGQGGIAFRATPRGAEVLAQGLLNAPPPPAPPPVVAQPAAGAPAFGAPIGWGGAPQPAFAAPPPPAPSPPAMPAPGAVVGGPGSGPARNFTFQKGVPIPPSRRRAKGTGANAYGFEQMEVGDCFVLPATAEIPNPAKYIASTVSSATKRLAPRTFTIRSLEEPNTAPGAPVGSMIKVARVWRTA